MKPQTLRQKEVAELSAKLSPISEKNVDWIKKNCFAHKGYYSKEEVWCSDCAHVFPYKSSDVGLKVVCPKCGVTLTIEKSRKKRAFDEKFYVSVFEAKGDYQVIRHYHVHRQSRKGQDVYVSIIEAVQVWINCNDGKNTIIARTVNPMCHYIDAWNFSSDLEIRRETNYYYYGSRYTIWSDYICPDGRIQSKVKRNGYKRSLNNVVNPSKVIPLLLTNSDVELLTKTRQYSLLSHYVKMQLVSIPYKHAVNICNRNNYIIKDASMWYDYLGFLDYFKLDTHNAKYVCPENLKEEHDKLMRRKTRIEEAKELKKKIEQAKAYEEDYKKSKSKYFGICFCNDKIVVTVLQSVAEFAEEGVSMHHCVFAAKYFSKKDALILSAKDKDGNRLETIEVNLKTLSIIQSRGICNENSPFHSEIVNLVNKNIKQIRKQAAA